MRQLFYIFIDFSNGKSANHDRDIIDAIHEKGLTKGKSLRAIDRVNAHCCEHESKDHRNKGLELIF